MHLIECDKYRISNQYRPSREQDKLKRVISNIIGFKNQALVNILGEETKVVSRSVGAKKDEPSLGKRLSVPESPMREKEWK